MAELFLPGEDKPFMSVRHEFGEAAPVVVQANPFSVDGRAVTVPQGATLAEMVVMAGITGEAHGFVRVYVDDAEIPRASWHLVRPRAGRHVYIRVMPMGGGSGGGKNILASLLMMVVVVAASVFAPMLAGAMFPGLAAGSFGLKLATGLIGAGISLLGTMAISGLIKPPSNTDAVTQRQLLSGVRNQFAPYATIPRHFGKRRVYPLQAARPYTEAQGADRYLRVLLAVGQGPLKISEIKIGDTPIENYSPIEVEVREGWHAAHAQFGALPAGKTPDTRQKLFTKTVIEDSFNVLLDDAGKDANGAIINAPGEWETRVTEPDTTEIIVDVTFPFGLASFDNKGRTVEVTIEVGVEYRLVGDTAWTSVVWAGNDADDGTATNGKLTCTDSSATPTSRGGRWITPEPGQYEVRLRRITKLLVAGTGGSFSQRTEWTALRSVKDDNPVNQPGMALIALRMKATDQLNGIPDTINCVVESYLPRFTGSDWQWEISRNPAWAYADVMRRRATTRAISDTRIDTATIRAWGTDCAATAPNADEARWEFNCTIEGGSIHSALRLIASHGRATFAIRDGRYSVAQDKAQTVPIQHITPRNSFGYAGTKAFIDLPHALKVQFINAANGYQEDEVIVYDDGYSEENATKFETIDLPGCTSPTQAWREGRYYLAVGQLRPEEHTVSMDVEHLRCSMGDYVMFAHDVLSIGVAYVRIASAISAGGLVTGYVLDTEVPREAGTRYVLRVRRASGASLLLPLVVKTGASDTTTQVDLITPIAPASAATVGDLAIYGELDLEAAPMMVKRIEPGPNMTAKLTLADAQPGVWTADTGPIPPFSTYVSETDPVVQKKPPAPTFSLVSDESVLERRLDGTLQERLAVTLGRIAGSRVTVENYEVQYRRTGSAEWYQAFLGRPRIKTSYITPVRQGDAYDVRVRTISAQFIQSDWVYENGHVVVGKTTPPANVQGFVGEGRVDGAQLRWNENTEIDVVAYTIKRGEDWDTAEVVSAKAKGTSLFVALDTKTPQTFLIRAVDAIGKMSLSPARVTVAVTYPGTVASFSAYPQDDAIRFKWSKVAGSSITYEIRAGEAWSVGRRIAVAAGNTTTVKLPAKLSGARSFWIKAVSAAGLSSPDARFVSVDHDPIVNRNAILEDDFSASTWPGTKAGVSVVGSGAASYLQMNKLLDGLTVSRADYYHAVSLPAQYYARNWLELDVLATVDAAMTWRQATLSWGDADGLTWIGGIEDSAGFDITPYIAIAQATAAPADLIEEFRLDKSTTGSNGTTPTAASGLYYLPLHIGDGLDAYKSGNLTYDLTLPSEFTIVFDFRCNADRGTYAPFLMGVLADPFTDPRSAGDQAGSFLLMRLFTPSVVMNLTHTTANGFRCSTTGQAAMDVDIEFDTGDLLTFCVSQTATTRRFMAYNHRTGVTASIEAERPPAAAFTSWRPIFSAAFNKAPGAIGNIEFRSGELTVGSFENLAPVRSPKGYTRFREMVPGDYRYEDAIIWLSMTCSDRALDIIVDEAVLNVDVPDRTEKGTQAITSAATAITYSTPFATQPFLNVTQTGGTVLALVRITGRSVNGFTVQLFDASSPATPVAGTISFTATGY